MQRIASIVRETAIVLAGVAGILGVLAGLVLRRGPTLVALAVLAVAFVVARTPIIPEEGWARIRLRHRILRTLGNPRWFPVVDEDDRGALHRSNIRWWREQIAVVEVANYTPEPDGTFRTFLIRVPPSIRTARAAVAWSFGLPEKEYRPEEES